MEFAGRVDVNVPSFDVNGEMRVAFRIIGLTGGKTNMKKRSNEDVC